MTKHCTQTFNAMIERYMANDLKLSEFISWAREWSEELLQNWPQEELAMRQAYADLWSDLLNRFESSALFTEESCSFSQSDLRLAMGRWVHKVESLIAKSSKN